MKETKFSRKLRSLGHSNYESYLASDHWRKKKEEYAKSDRPKKCLSCPRSDYILHHLTYENLGAELLDDFMPLCMGCHHRLHTYMKTKGWAYSEEEVIDLLLKRDSIVKLTKKPKTKRKKKQKPVKIPAAKIQQPIKQSRMNDVMRDIQTLSLDELKTVAGTVGRLIHSLKSFRQTKLYKNETQRPVIYEDLDRELKARLDREP